MLILGLTGGIATGKSTVSKLLSQPPHDLPVIDADVIAREVVNPGTLAYKQIIKHFSPTTPDLLHTPETDPIQPPSTKGASINRAVLGRRVFGDTEDKKKDRAVLNGIVHPAVRKEMVYLTGWYWITGHWAVVLDVPLLFESELDMFCTETLFIGVHNEKVQIQRLLARDSHLSKEDARNRVASQMSVQKKAKLADTVIWNDGTKKQLEEEVAKVVEKLKSGRTGLWVYFWIIMWPTTFLIVIGTLGYRWFNKAERKSKSE